MKRNQQAAYRILLIVSIAFFALIVCKKSHLIGEVGTKAPIFEAKDENGNLWRSSDYAGENILVVYFYPAAMTGG